MQRDALAKRAILLMIYNILQTSVDISNYVAIESPVRRGGYEEDKDGSCNRAKRTRARMNGNLRRTTKETVGGWNSGMMVATTRRKRGEGTTEGRNVARN